MTDSLKETMVSIYHNGNKELTDHCIMEEIKNNNTTALNNYETLIKKLNDELSSVNTQKTLSATEKIVLDKIIEIKTKAISRRAALKQRVQNNQSYKVSNYTDFSSYSSFSPALNKRKSSNEAQFKVPALKQTQQPKEINSSLEAPRAGKSLDLPRPKQSSQFTRSKSPSIRKERPKSIDLSINQAAVLAWDQNLQKKRSVQPNSPVLRPHVQIRSVSAGGKSPQLPKRKHQYTQPTINTQINLTPVSRPSQISRANPVSPSTQISKPALITTSSSNKIQQQQQLPKLKKKYKDKRIPEMLENLEGVDFEACEQILNEIMVTDEQLTWDDIAGLESAKRSLKETVVYPFLRPDLFKGLREPISGMLLFGPPGTGKTMIAKTVANESRSTYFSISASSLLSKYLGESEKLIRALFYVAKKLSPSIIFFDEVDSLLTARGDGEHESSRRVKTEFLIQWSSLVSATAHNSETETPRVLVLGATNLPWAIDEAARRRFSRRLYIPLPGFETRLIQIKRLLQDSSNTLSDSDYLVIANLIDGYSGSDITSLAKEAAMEPIRELGDDLVRIQHKEIRDVSFTDFETAMQTIKRSVGDDDLKRFEVWASKFGSSGS